MAIKNSKILNSKISKPSLSKPRERKLGGFSLIELALVLTIAGFSIGAGLVVFNEYARISKISNTKLKLQEILYAIDDYADKFNRLPCPADGTDKFGDPNFGVSIRGAASCTNVNGSTGVTMGMVPVSTLNLYPTFGLDAWNRRISYVVHAASVDDDGMDSTANDLDLENYDGSSNYNDVVVVLISHGENGFGAYNGRGGAKSAVPIGTNAAEVLNTQVTGAFRASVSVASFDDVVYFWTRDQITDDSME